MAITRQKKEEVVSQVSDAAKNAQSLVFVHFSQVPVQDVNEIRSTLRDQDVSYTVAKKTLIKRALAETNIEGEQPALEGEIAIAYGDDLLAPAREVYAFQKKHKDNIAIVGGVYDGVYKNKEEMLEIALIPPIDTLRGQFLNVINSPVQGLAVALNAIAEKKA